MNKNNICKPISVPVSRKAPPFKAKDCPNLTKVGMDGESYISKKYPSGYRWSKVGHKTITEKRKECQKKDLVLDMKTKKCRESKRRVMKKMNKENKEENKEESDVVKISNTDFIRKYLNYIIDEKKFCRTDNTVIDKDFIRFDAKMPRSFFYVLYNGEKIKRNITAFALIYRNKKYSEVRIICSDKGKGYGKRLIQEIEKRESKVTRNIIVCSLREPLNFYMKIGYRVITDEMCRKLDLLFCPENTMMGCLLLHKRV